jgi:hypothetical protein
MQLLLSNWLAIVKENCGQKKLIIREKGLIFLEKYLGPQKIVGIKSKHKSMMSAPKIQTVMMQAT